MKPRSLFKYYADRRWAEAFLDGELLFRSLAYFRDYEDEMRRGDSNEGKSVFRPEGGLVVHNRTQRRTITLPKHAFTSRAKQAEIFVFCMSRSLNEALREEFDAVACIEIVDIPGFCRRVMAALPAEATFPGRPGHTRIAHRVDYYPETQGSNPRWALPDMIAISKLDPFARQDEFRLVFSLTDALAFEKVETRLEPDGARDKVDPSEHRTHLVTVGGLRDICRLHLFEDNQALGPGARPA